MIGPVPRLKSLLTRTASNWPCGHCVPAERRRVGVEIQEQAVLDEVDQLRGARDVGRVVAGQQARQVGGGIRERVRLEVEGHVRVLLGELRGELRHQLRDRLVVDVQRDRVGAAVRHRLPRRTRWRRPTAACRWTRVPSSALAWRRDGARAPHIRSTMIAASPGSPASRWRSVRPCGVRVPCDSSSILTECDLRRRVVVYARPSFGGADVARMTSSGSSETTGGTAERCSISASSSSAPTPPGLEEVLADGGEADRARRSGCRRSR